MFWDEKTETLPKRDLEELQLTRLKKTIAQVQNVEFYRKKLKEAGVRPDDIRTLGDIEKIPFTRKQDLRDGYPFGFFAVPLQQVVRI
ncbi:MAG TPA: phenylacetate--CoA ligase, partial [Methanolinea sp.]|nr:phenylacetate--CoA ligase [Methanolinea sp.]